jgi:predicted site-specific integrase-resolvase
MSQHYSTTQAAAMMGVPKRTLSHWMKTGKVKGPTRRDHHGWVIWSLGEIRNVARAQGKEVVTGIEA